MKSTAQESLEPLGHNTSHDHVAVAREAFRSAWAAAWWAMRELPMRSDTQSALERYQLESAMHDNMLRQHAEKYGVTTQDIVDGL